MRRVIKIGGSLLQRADLVAQVNRWLDRQPAGSHWMLLGGGGMVDALRELDRVHSFDQERMHWRCVDLLETTFSIMRELFPEWRPIDDAEELNQQAGLPDGNERYLVCIRSFYGKQLNNVLPCSWSVTSDSLAALLAMRIGADELVLLKSCQISGTPSLAELAKMEVVDTALPGLCDSIPRVRVERLGE
jgi:5-(aminomethyl)-3-furanmethanol phosphate kinase